MAPETFGHVDAKFRIARLLEDAIAARNLRCRVLLDGMGVQADHDHVYIPDVMIQCGEPIPAADRIVDDPMVVVEVVSRSTRHVDEAYKLIGYFARPTVRHYLIVYPDTREIVHHERRADGLVMTHFHGDEPIRLDPPGIVLEGAFPPAA